MFLDGPAEIRTQDLRRVKATSYQLDHEPCLMKLVLSDNKHVRSYLWFFGTIEVR